MKRLSRRLNIDLGYWLGGSSALMADYVLVAMIQLCVTLCFANFVPKETYGLYGWVQAVCSLLVIFTLPGFPAAMVRSVARGYEGDYARGQRIRVLFGLIGSSVLIAMAVGYWASGFEQRACGLLLASALFPLVFPLADARSWLEGRQRFGWFAVAQVGSVALASAATIAAIFISGNFLVILAANFAGRAASNLIVTFASLGRSANRETSEEFIPFGRNLTLSQIPGVLAYSFDRVYIGSVIDMVVMANYHLAFTVADPVRILGTLVNKLAYPRLVNRSGPELVSKVRRRVWLLIPGLALVGLAYGLLMNLAVPLFFSKYVDALPLINLMIVSSLIGVLTIYFETFFLSQDRLHKMYYTVSVGRPLLIIALTPPLIYLYGAIGAVWARLAVRALASVVLWLRLLTLPGKAKEEVG
ncbi:MAG: oligosaccharide flippase family protein [Candidatus Alcyoniella australis]|nr:oligosaccharide flippase family protein [Candidatus Alcyoniella australis]